MPISRCLRLLLALALVMAAAPTIGSGAQRYMIAPDSSVAARVAFFGLASKTARFPKVSGEITLDPAKLDSIGLTVTIDAKALTAGDRVTRERLKGPAFFDVGRHPTITFTGRDMRLTGARTAEVSGQLTARGVTRPVRLNVVFAADPRSAGKAPLRLTGRTTIDRRDFGMTAYSVVVGRKVTITLDVRVTPG